MESGHAELAVTLIETLRQEVDLLQSWIDKANSYGNSTFLNDGMIKRRAQLLEVIHRTERKING